MPPPTKNIVPKLLPWSVRVNQPLPVRVPLTTRATAIAENAEERAREKKENLGELIYINDPRKIRRTTGQPLKPTERRGGKVSKKLITEIIGYAKKYNIDPNEAVARAIIESEGNPSYNNPFHILLDSEVNPHGSKIMDSYASGVEAGLVFVKQKEDEFNRLVKKGKISPENRDLLRLQIYNGLGKLFPDTEGAKGWMYGVKIPEEGLKMTDNPLYAKELLDIVDIVKANPEIQSIVKSTQPTKTTTQYGPLKNKVYVEPKEFGKGGEVKNNKYSSIPRTGLRYPNIVRLPSGQRSFYDPVEETIYLADGEDPTVVQHEMFHHWQKLNNNLSSGPVQKPSMLDLNPAGMYNRRSGDEAYETKMFLNSNPSFINVPFNLLHDKAIDPAMYYYPEYAEGEAEEYQNYINQGGEPVFPSYAKGGLIKRKDGSYSKRGLWDNIRANRGSGRRPTKEMLRQERKIRAAEKKEDGGPVYNWIPEYPRVGARNEHGGWLDQYENGSKIVKPTYISPRESTDTVYTPYQKPDPNAKGQYIRDPISEYMLSIGLGLSPLDTPLDIAMALHDVKKGDLENLAVSGVGALLPGLSGLTLKTAYGDVKAYLDRKAKEHYDQLKEQNKQKRLQKKANGGSIEDQRIPTPAQYEFGLKYAANNSPTLTTNQMGTPRAYAHGATVFTKQTTPSWVAGTPTPTTTQKEIAFNRSFSPGTAVPYPEVKIPASAYTPASPPVLQGYNPYNGPMRLHAPDTTQIARDGGRITEKYKKRAGIPYAISPGVSNVGMYVGPTTQRGITFANGGWLDTYATGEEETQAGPTVSAAAQLATKPYFSPAVVQSVLAKANQPVTTTTGRVISTPETREKERREKIIAEDPSKYTVEDYKKGIQEPGAGNSVLDDPLALAAAATAGGVALGAYGLSQVPRMFLGNLASEATAGLSDLRDLTSISKTFFPKNAADLTGTGFKENPYYHYNTFKAKKQEIVDALRTPEGKKRLQGYIDNNPHYKKLNKSVEEIIDDFNNTTFEVERPVIVWDEILKEYKMVRDEKGDIIYEPVNPNNAYNWYRWGTNNPSFVSMGQNFTPYDARHILEHEFAHTFQRSRPLVEVDNALTKISLKENKELATKNIKQIFNKYNPFNTTKDVGYSVSGNIFGTGTYLPKYYRSQALIDAKNYWIKGSRGQEKAAFAAEVRENLLQRGLLNNRYDKITPDLLEKHYKLYNKTKGAKYNLRLYDIMHPTKENFNILSSVLNKMPAVLPAVAIGAQAIQQDNNKKSSGGWLDNL